VGQLGILLPCLKRLDDPLNVKMIEQYLCLSYEEHKFEYTCNNYDVFYKVRIAIDAINKFSDHYFSSCIWQWTRLLLVTCGGFI
jgi:hypothetical protein